MHTAGIVPRFIQVRHPRVHAPGCLQEFAIGVGVGTVEDGFRRRPPRLIPVLLDEVDVATDAAGGDDGVIGGGGEGRVIVFVHAADAGGLPVVGVDVGDVVAEEDAKIAGILVPLNPSNNAITSPCPVPQTM